MKLLPREGEDVGLFVAGLCGLAGAVVLGVGSTVFFGRWYARLKRAEPPLGERGSEYARWLLAGSGYAVERGGRGWSRCDYGRRVVVLCSDAWQPGLDGVLVAAHEVGHALLDKGLAVRCTSGAARTAIAVIWLAAVLLSGWLGVPALAFLAVGGSLVIVADMAVREVRACRFAREVVGRDFLEPACRAWVGGQTRAWIWHTVLMAVALGLFFASLAAVLYAWAGVVRDGVLGRA